MSRPWLHKVAWLSGAACAAAGVTWAYWYSSGYVGQASKNAQTSQRLKSEHQETQHSQDDHSTEQHGQPQSTQVELVSSDAEAQPEQAKGGSSPAPPPTPALSKPNVVASDENAVAVSCSGTGADAACGTAEGHAAQLTGAFTTSPHCQDSVQQTGPAAVLELNDSSAQGPQCQIQSAMWESSPDMGPSTPRAHAGGAGSAEVNSLTAAAVHNDLHDVSGSQSPATADCCSSDKQPRQADQSQEDVQPWSQSALSQMEVSQQHEACSRLGKPGGQPKSSGKASQANHGDGYIATNTLIEADPDTMQQWQQQQQQQEGKETQDLPQQQQQRPERKETQELPQQQQEARQQGFLHPSPPPAPVDSGQKQHMRLRDEWLVQRRTSLDSDAWIQQGAGQSAADTRQHRSFNTARHAPSLDTTVSSAAVARNLEVQYAISGRTGVRQQSTLGSEASWPTGGCTAGSLPVTGAPAQMVSSLAASCASLCVQHCSKLQDATGHETTVLDIGCGTGGCCFELAASFNHVLGIDGDLLNITAAKELKAHGLLSFKLETSSSAEQQSAAEDDLDGQQTATVHVPSHIDRDRVRFWHYPLPQLPPKLQPVDAVLLEDVEVKLGPELQNVCEQLSELLNPEGVCVVVLGAGVSCKSCVEHDAADSDASEGHLQHNSSKMLLDHVKTWLQDAGLVFLQQLMVQYERSGKGMLQAHAAVWLKPS